MKQERLPVDLNALDSQIKAVSGHILDSEVENGLGTLLTGIYFQLKEFGEVTLIDHKPTNQKPAGSILRS